MDHPFFTNSKLLVIYIITWIVITAVHVFSLQYFWEINFSQAITDGIVYNFLFALLGIPVWYIVIYSKPGKYAFTNQLINHISSASIILIIWISCCNAILKAIFDDVVYRTFLENSISWRIISGLFFYSILVLIYYIIIYYNDQQERIIREAKLNDIVKQAELDNLRSQINPHFLFNSLNSISSLTITNPEKAHEMIIKLSDFLRYSISQPGNALSSLKAEIENIHRYLDIEKTRFGTKLISEIAVENECFEMKIPAMMLQPLFENAVKHGVYESVEPITIKTECTKKDEYLSIIISNNFDPAPKHRKGEGIGLKNISERLKILYRRETLIKTKSENNIFEIELLIPQA
jgi:sensor histidine kinase YesM